MLRPSPPLLLVGVCTALVVSLGAVGAPTPARAAGTIGLEARIDGRDLDGADANDPVPLRPGTPSVIEVDVTNDGADPLEVRSVRLEGRVLGLAFYRFDTVVNMVVPAGGADGRRFEVDLGELRGQATGLIPSTVQLLDPSRHVVARRTFIADVRGSSLSVYGLFGFAVAGFTAGTLAAALVGLARRSLPASRARRCLRFLVPGVGLGLTATFTLSVVRALAPTASTWAPLLVACSVAAAALGYLSPPPPVDEVDDDEDDVDEADDDEVAPVAPPAAGAPLPPPVGPAAPAQP